MEIEQLFTINYIVFCLAIAGITEIINRLIIFFVLDNPRFKSTRFSKFFKNVVFPSVSVIVGVIISIISSDYSFPKNAKLIDARVMLGIVAGLSSAGILRILNSTFSDSSIIDFIKQMIISKYINK